MPLKILGLNHNTAPVEIREQVVFAGEQIPGALQAVRDIDGVDEAVLLSTCNRTEFYVMADDAGRRRLQDWLYDAHNLDPSFADTLFELDDAPGLAAVQQEYMALAASLWAGTEGLPVTPMKDRDLFDFLGFD